MTDLTFFKMFREAPNYSSICSECFNTITDEKKLIKHNNWNYCGVECLQYRIRTDYYYEWIKFKNLIDIYNDEEVMGESTNLA